MIAEKLSNEVKLIFDSLGNCNYFIFLGKGIEPIPTQKKSCYII